MQAGSAVMATHVDFHFVGLVKFQLMLSVQRYGQSTGCKLAVQS